MVRLLDLMLRAHVFLEVVGLREARAAAGVLAGKRLVATMRELMPREVARRRKALGAKVAFVRRHSDVDDAHNQLWLRVNVSRQTRQRVMNNHTINSPYQFKIKIL